MEQKYIELVNYFQRKKDDFDLSKAYKKPSEYKQYAYAYIVKKYIYDINYKNNIGTYIRSFNCQMFSTATLLLMEDGNYHLYIDYPTRIKEYIFTIDDIRQYYNATYDNIVDAYNNAIEDRNNRLTLWCYNIMRVLNLLNNYCLAFTEYTP